MALHGAHASFRRSDDRKERVLRIKGVCEPSWEFALAQHLRPARDRSLVIVDDEEPFRLALERAMTSHGFDASSVGVLDDALASIDANPPAFAVVDLRIGEDSGLELLDAISARRPDARVIILTGYGDIRTAVAAIKSGAHDYIAKPVTAAEIAAALLADRRGKPELPENFMRPKEARLEHINHVLKSCRGQVTETARQLNMHRRTLQRILRRTRRT